MTTKKKTLTIAAAILGTAALAGCGSAPQPDEVAVRYDSPPFSGTNFARCVAPGEFNMAAPWSGAEYTTYPAGQRTFTFQGDGAGVDSPAFTANTKDGVEMTVSGQVAFRLDESCDNLRSFHENVGRFNNAGEAEGWANLLRKYLGQSIQRAMNDATQAQEWKGLYSDPKVKAAWEAKVKELLPQYVNQAMGGAYLTDFSPTIQKPDVPENLRNALAASQEAVEQNRAQKARNEQVKSELQSIRELVAVLGPDGYNTYQAIKDGKITVMPIPQGSSVVVQPTPKEAGK